jgi:Transposase IS116/IS110/IS902 family
MRRTAEVLIAEIGVDMNALPTSKDLASWASVCPGNDESAGKRRSGTTRKGEKVAGLSSPDGPGLIPPAAASSSGRDRGRAR